MKKKFLAGTSILLVLVMVFAFGSCKKDNEDTIKNTITAAMEAFVSFDKKELKKHVESSVMTTLDKNLKDLPDGDALVKGLLEGMSYQVNSITINEEPEGKEKKVSATASADIVITAKDFRKKAALYQLSVFGNAKLGKIDLTDDAYLKGEVQRLIGVINAKDVATIETPMTLELEKRSGKWIVILSGAPQNAMFGGAGSALNQILSYISRAKDGSFETNAVTDGATTSKAN